MKEKKLLKAAALPAGAIVVAAMSGMVVMAEEADEPVAIEAQSGQETMSTEPVIEEQAENALGEIEADQDQANADLDVAVPQPDGTTEMLPTPAPSQEEEEKPNSKNPIVNVENIQEGPVSGLVTAPETSQQAEVKLNVALDNVVIPGQEINGAGNTTGSSYYNFLAYYSEVKQAKQLMDEYPDAVFKDSLGNIVTNAKVDAMLNLLDRINRFDANAGIRYDWDSVYNAEKFEQEQWRGGLDVVAGDDLASIRFHIDSHGWWGYELVGDTIIQDVMPDEVTDGLSNKEVANKYSNFFVIDMKKPTDTWKGSMLLLKDTDLQNPVIYLNEDKSEAMMIDLDFYGENVLAQKIKEVIGANCKKLTIFFTHNHPDHVNNLEFIMKDPELMKIVNILWPKDEPNPGKTIQVDGQKVNILDACRELGIVKDLADGNQFSVGGLDFVFSQIKDEHTPAGGQLVDVTNKILHSGDTLGAQVHLGGTNVSLSQIDSWIAGAQKTIDTIRHYGLEYIIGGHTSYLNTPKFADWLKTACEYAKAQWMKDPQWNGGLVIVENGQIVTSERMGEMMKNGLTDREELNVLSVNFRNDLKNKLQGDREQAVDEITVSKLDANGNDLKPGLSEEVKKAITDNPVTATRRNNELKFDCVVLHANLTSDILNGAGKPDGSSWTGTSYYNFLKHYVNLKQVKQIADANEGLTYVDANGDSFTAQQLADLLDLMAKINAYDPGANLKYDWDSVYNAKQFNEDNGRGGTDVIATGSNGVSLRFHIDSHGWWGYELAGDSLMTEIVGATDDAGKQLEGSKRENDHYLATKYGNFFVIDMKKPGDSSEGKWFMLRDTDLQNPMLYVSADGKEALMIDVDFYGENVLANLLKQLLGLGGNVTRAIAPNCERLNIFFTHMHGDHVNNLVSLMNDPALKSIIHVYWPDGEPHTMVDGKDVVEMVDPDRLTNMKDGFTYEMDGIPFVFNQIVDEHTPNGGQFADLKNKILYSGDTLGAQVHLGGTTVNLKQLDSWIAGAKKTIAFIVDNGLEYVIGGHTPYLNTPEFANWLLEACEYAKAQLAADPNWSGLVIVENGKVVSAERMAEMMKNGLTDREELAVLSVNFRKAQVDQPTQPEDPTTPDEPQEEQKTDANKNENKVVPTTTKRTIRVDAGKTSPNTGVNVTSNHWFTGGWIVALAGLLAQRKRERR
ncbi:MBL fold metallo-hydrolase [uncultured Dubosiella sp.]|nr:MBL fold metallo-hydrolase [uncultured Dubosiella sp.]